MTQHADAPSPPPGPAAWPAWRWAMLALVFVALVVAARVVVDAQRALAAGREADSRGDFDGAVFHYRSAAKAYVPLLPANAEALDALLALARAAEERGEWMQALHAYDAVRVGTLGARWMMIPHADRLAQANARLPHVMLEARRTHPLAPPWQESQREGLLAEFQAAVTRDYLPPPGWALLASGGFAVWLLGLFAAIWRGVRPEGGFHRRELLRWGTVAGVGLLCWLGALAYLAVARGGGG